MNSGVGRNQDWRKDNEFTLCWELGVSFSHFFILVHTYLLFSQSLQFLGLALAVIFHDHHGCIDFAHCQVSSCKVKKVGQWRMALSAYFFSTAPSGLQVDKSRLFGHSLQLSMCVKGFGPLRPLQSGSPGKHLRGSSNGKYQTLYGESPWKMTS